MFATTVDLLRHGELQGGIRYRGHQEAALTSHGRNQMNAVWETLKGQVDVIVTSPLLRCSELAHVWADEADIPCHTEPLLREFYYGEWEGLNHEEIEARFPGWLMRWRKNPVGIEIPGAERIEDFDQRIRMAWRAVLEKHEGKHILLVAHSGTLRIILAAVLNAPLPTIRRFTMPYAAWSRLLYDGEQGCLDFLNRSNGWQQIDR